MSKDYTAVMLEKIYDEIKAVHELVAGQPTRIEFNELKRDMAEVKRDVRVIKAAVTDTNRDLAEHKHSRCGPWFGACQALPLVVYIDALLDYYYTGFLSTTH